MLLDEEEKEAQQQLLKTYRATLRHLLLQAAQFGGEALAPPQVAHGIKEAQQQIQRIKTTLGQAGIEVTDYPDDGLPVVEPYEINQQTEDSKTVVDDFTIVNAADIIDATIAQVEARLGAPLTSQKRSIMGTEDLPDGGETREYCSGMYRFAINFSKQGTATGIMVTEGLIDEHYTLEHWPVIFSRLSVVVLDQPDIVAPAARRWQNYKGYGLAVAATDIHGGPVWMVRVYKLPIQG